jgi:hypothetical protein
MSKPTLGDSDVVFVEVPSMNASSSSSGRVSPSLSVETQRQTPETPETEMEDCPQLWPETSPVLTSAASVAISASSSSAMETSASASSSSAPTITYAIEEDLPRATCIEVVNALNKTFEIKDEKERERQLALLGPNVPKVLGQISVFFEHFHTSVASQGIDEFQEAEIEDHFAEKAGYDALIKGCVASYKMAQQAAKALPSKDNVYSMFAEMLYAIDPVAAAIIGPKA